MGTFKLSPTQQQSINETCDARNDSVDSVAALCAFPAIPLPLKRRLEHLLEFDHRVQIFRFAFEAGELRLRTRPTKVYLSRVAAVPARYFDQCPVVVHFRHGWPILSLVFGNSNVTEAGAAAKRPGGGFHRDQAEGDA